MNEYEKQANEFCEKTNTSIKIEFLHSGKHFDDDKHNRDIYNITISRNNRQFSFKFGNSLINSREYLEKNYIKKHNSKMNFAKYLKDNLKKPTKYDVLASLTKYDPGLFEDFCSDYGYDTDSRKALETYLKVQDEWSNVRRIFSDVIEELAEIQ